VDGVVCADKALLLGQMILAGLLELLLRLFLRGPFLRGLAMEVVPRSSAADEQEAEQREEDREHDDERIVLLLVVGLFLSPGLESAAGDGIAQVRGEARGGAAGDHDLAAAGCGGCSKNRMPATPGRWKRVPPAACL
jgi:hypothetical protein